MTVLFEDLAEELVIRILHYCDAQVLLRVAATCKKYFRLVKDSVSLRLHLELEEHSIEIAKDSTKGHASYSTILEELKTHHEAWLHGRFDTPIKQTIGYPRRGKFELRDGAFVKAFSSQSRDDDSIPNSIQIFPLGSPSPLVPVQLPFVFDAFSVDLLQELAVFVKMDSNGRPCARVCLCSTATGQPHVLAQYPVFTVEIEPQGAYHRIEASETEVEVVGDMCFVSFRSNHKVYLLVWDWKTGALLFQICTPANISEFGFLDKDHFLFFSDNRDGTLTHPRLIIYSLPYILSDGNFGEDMPSNHHFLAFNHSSPEPVLILGFPEIDKSFTTALLSILEQNPSPGRPVRTPSGALSYSFNESTTLCLSLILYKKHRDYYLYFRIFVSGRRLLDQLRLCISGETTFIPWSEWGEEATRWFTEPLDRSPNLNGLHRMSGPRFLRSNISKPVLYGSKRDDTTISIIDFHTSAAGRSPSIASESHPCMPEPTKRAEDLPLDGTWTNLIPSVEELKTHMTIGEPSPQDKVYINSFGEDTKTLLVEGFNRPVESRLPFKIITLARPMPNCQDWLIEINHIIGVYQSPREPKWLWVYKLQTTSVNERPPALPEDGSD